MGAPLDRSLHSENALTYTSASQRARVLTERWVATNIRCPQCERPLRPLGNNTPGRDFECGGGHTFQLKSYRGKRTSKLMGAEYATTRRVFCGEDMPGLLVLRYTPDYRVDELLHYPAGSVQDVHIVARRPLSQKARRAGWQGCVIHLGELLPQTLLMGLDVTVLSGTG